MNSIIIVPVKRHRFEKIRTRERDVFHKIKYVTRADTTNINIQIEEIKYTKAATILIKVADVYYYSQTFEALYKSLYSKRRDTITMWMSFNTVDLSLTIKDSITFYFMSDWGIVNKKENE